MPRSSSPDAADPRLVAAGARAWRDTVLGVAIVLAVVSIFGYQWRTSWVLVGVLALAFIARGVHVLLAARQDR